MNGKFRILLALGVGLLLVGGSFYLSREHAPVSDAAAEALVAAAPDRGYITVADSDADGIADWMETLPRIPAVAGTTTASTTHTEQVAIYTLERLLQQNMSGSGNPSDILAQSTAYLANLATDKPFTRDDIRIGGGVSAEELRAYGNRIAAMTFENSTGEKLDSETAILGRALKENDPSKLAGLSRITASYAGVVEDMQSTLVPPAYAAEHLALLNAYAALRADLAAMEQAFTDPVYALARFGRYEADARALYQAISDLYLKLHEAGIEWNENDAVSDFIRIEYRS